MPNRTIIIKNFPGGYGKAVAFPTIIASMGMCRWALTLEGEWWECSHEMWDGVNWDYPGNEFGRQEQENYLRLKKYLTSKGCYKMYGWRGDLWEDGARYLFRTCYGHDKDHHAACKRLFKTSLEIDFNNVPDPEGGG